MGLGFLMMFFLTNYLGAEEYGRFSLSITIFQLLILLGSFGLPHAVLKFTADSRNFDNGRLKSNYFSMGLITLLSISIIVGGIIALFNGFIANKIFNDPNIDCYLQLISGGIVFGSFHSFILEFLRGKQNYLIYGLGFYVIPYLVFFVLSLFFILLNASHYYVFLSLLCGYGFTGLYLGIKYIPKGFTKNIKTFSVRKYSNLAFPMLMSSAALFLIDWADVIMLGMFVPNDELGIYNASFKLASVVLLIIQSVNIIEAPKFSNLFSSEKIKELGLVVQNAGKWTALLSIPLTIFLILFSEPLLNLFGKEFIQGKQILRIIGASFFLVALAGPASQLMNMTDFQRPLRNFTLYAVVINIILNYLFIKAWGIIGAGIATSISILALNIMCVIFVKRKFGIFSFYWPFHRINTAEDVN